MFEAKLEPPVLLSVSFLPIPGRLALPWGLASGGTRNWFSPGFLKLSCSSSPPSLFALGQIVSKWTGRKSSPLTPVSSSLLRSRLFFSPSPLLSPFAVLISLFRKIKKDDTGTHLLPLVPFTRLLLQLDPYSTPF